MRTKTQAKQEVAPPPPVLDPSRERALRGLAGIVGQDHAVGILRAALVQGRPHHAYLFEGPAGIGKSTCAKALFAALNCLYPPGPGDACGQCSSCEKLKSGNHPDLIPFDMTLSGLADEAERLVRRLGYPPHEGRAQMVIFDPADNFTMPTAQTAANRLLKTLEEPIAGTYFVLLASSAQALLPTIRSRTQRLRFTPLPESIIEREVLTLRSAQGLPDVPRETLSQVFQLCQGSLGKALQQLQEAEKLAQRDRAALALLQAGNAGTAEVILQAAAEAGQEREEAQEILNLVWLHLHNELPSVLQEGGRAQDRWLKRLRAVKDAKEAILRNTAAPLSMERMLRYLHLSKRDEHEGATQKEWQR